MIDDSLFSCNVPEEFDEWTLDPIVYDMCIYQTPKLCNPKPYMVVEHQINKLEELPVTGPLAMDSSLVTNLVQLQAPKVGLSCILVYNIKDIHRSSL